MKYMKRAVSLLLALLMVLSLAACGSSGTTEEDSQADTSVGSDESDVSSADDLEDTSADVIQEDEQPEEVVEEEAGGPTEEILNAEIWEGKVQIGTEIITVGESIVSAFFDAGYTVSESSSGRDEYSSEYMVYGGESDHLYATLEDVVITFHYENPNEDSIALKDCVITELEVDEFSEFQGVLGYRDGACSIYTAGGVGGGDSIASVTEALGEPYDTSEGDDALSYHYRMMTVDTVGTLYVRFDRNTSSVTEIDVVAKPLEVFLCEDYYSVDYCYFPYIAQFGYMETAIRAEYQIYLTDVAEDACIDEVNAVFYQYFTGEITEAEYAAAVVPILESYGYYEALYQRAVDYGYIYLLQFVSDRDIDEKYGWSTTTSWYDFLEGELAVDLEEGLNSVYYGPLLEIPETEETYDECWEKYFG